MSEETVYFVWRYKGEPYWRGEMSYSGYAANEAFFKDAKGDIEIKLVGTRRGKDEPQYMEGVFRLWHWYIDPHSQRYMAPDQEVPPYDDGVFTGDYDILPTYVSQPNMEFNFPYQLDPNEDYFIDIRFHVRKLNVGYVHSMRLSINNPEQPKLLDFLEKMARGEFPRAVVQESLGSTTILTKPVSKQDLHRYSIKSERNPKVDEKEYIKVFFFRTSKYRHEPLMRCLIFERGAFIREFYLKLLKHQQDNSELYLEWRKKCTSAYDKKPRDKVYFYSDLLEDF